MHQPALDIANPTSTAASRQDAMAADGRIASIDMLRGLVILIMMLDHVRERFVMHLRTGDPIYDSIEPDLFFTRYITHLCAPIFIFLAGVSAWLYANPSSGSVRSPSAFLFKRGAIIILIEFVFYYLVWFDSYPNFLFLQVLFAIGASMIALAVACHLNYHLLGMLAFAIVLGHLALAGIKLEPGDTGYVLWATLYQTGNLGQIGPLTVSLSYPVLPWFGVIALGYYAGPLYAYTVQSDARRRVLVLLGVGCLFALTVIRGLNLYGEVLPWSAQETALRTLMSFLNFTKYPPSPNFLLITLGTGFLLLAWLEKAQPSTWFARVLKTYGSVPMFIYVLHLYVLLAAYWILYGVYGATHGTRFGVDGVWPLWAGALMLTVGLYPIASAFSRYKHEHKRDKPWLSYF